MPQLQTVLAFLIGFVGFSILAWIVIKRDHKVAHVAFFGMYCLIFALGVAYYGVIVPTSIKGGGIEVTAEQKKEIREAGEQVKKEVVEQIQKDVRDLFSRLGQTKNALAEQNKISEKTLRGLVAVQRSNAPRRLTGTKRDRFVRLLRDSTVRPVPKSKFRVSIAPYDFEIVTFAEDIESALLEAGWLDKGTQRNEPPTRLDMAMTAQGILLYVEHARDLLPDESLLRDAFDRAGFARELVITEQDSKNFVGRGIVIGSKRPASAN